MNDMASTIIPKSDQLNADDLIAGPITVKITAVAIKGGQEQPIAISYEGDNGKPYKPCKSMCRVMVTAWGADSKKYIGRSMTLYRDDKVKWAGMEVGGIRISHMSHIDEAMTMALTVTRANRKPFTVKPLVTGKPSSSAAPAPASSLSSSLGEPGASAAAGSISADQAVTLERELSDAHWPIEAFKKKAGITRLDQLLAEDYEDAIAACKRRQTEKRQTA